MGALFGWLVLAVLTAFAAYDAIGIALRANPSGRAELAMVATAAFFALLGFPGLILGYANVLTKTTLGITAALLFSVIFAALVRGRSWRAHSVDCLNAVVGLLRVPVDAAREATRARSVVVLGLLCSAWILAAAFVLTVLLPNTTWDGLIYHDPMVGFAIQNRGFSSVALPMRLGVQATNGYPRLCETVSLWFVIFTDKTLIELPNDLAAPAMMLAAYALTRRFGDRVTAMGWACVVFLMPQAWAELCQTLVDLAVGFFALVSIYFATRAPYRVRDALCATLGMALLLGSKASALAFVPFVALVAYGRLLQHHVRARRATAIATVAGGSAVLALVALVPLVHNWAAFRDPFWPISFVSPRLGIDWRGLASVQEATADASLREQVQVAYGIPVGGMGDVNLRGYGYAIAWVVIPVGLVATAIGSLTAALEWSRRRTASRASDLGLILVLTLAAAMTTPTLGGHDARYNLHLVVGLLAATTWLLAKNTWARLREGLLGAAVVLSMIPLQWMKGIGWYWVSTEHLEDVLRHPWTSRVALERPAFDLLGRKRLAELGPGDRVVFDDDVDFVGALWNFEFSNRVEYVHYESSSAFLDAVDRPAAKWVAVGASGDARKALERAQRWELVGELTPGGNVVFRRRAGG